MGTRRTRRLRRQSFVIAEVSILTVLTPGVQRIWPTDGRRDAGPGNALDQFAHRGRRVIGITEINQWDSVFSAATEDRLCEVTLSLTAMRVVPLFDSEPVGRRPIGRGP